MGLGYYLQFGFAQHALEAAFFVAVSCGLIGPFVITRTMAFAVHGTSELAFTGAVAGLLVGGQPTGRRAASARSSWPDPDRPSRSTRRRSATRPSG